MKEHDIVFSKVQIEEIPAKCRGTIVHVYENNRDRLGDDFEVEFSDEHGKTIAVKTVNENQITLNVNDIK